MGWVPHLKGRVRYIFFALWMPILLGIIGAVLYYVIFPDAFNLEFSGYRWQLEQAGELEQLEVQLEAQGMTMPMYMLVSLIGAVTYGPIVNMFTAIGEEVGWRGAMYPYLKEKLGVTKGRILGGTIWGIWHWPAILMGHNYGLNYFGAPFLGPLAMVWFTIVIGVLFSWVTINSESVWPAVIGHGALNGIAALSILFIKGSPNPLLGPAPTGIIGGAGFFLIALIIFLHPKSLEPKIKVPSSPPGDHINELNT